MDDKREIVENGKSEWANVTSGIPQGSVLALTVIVIFINDLPDVVTSTVQIFADDTKIYRTVNDIRERILLQVVLYKLHQRSIKYQFKFNAKKCKVMHLGSKNPKVDYVMDDINLDKVTEEKDLDVLIDEELNFQKHGAAAVSKANQILGIVKRTFDTLDKDLLHIVYKHQVRPHFEYENAI